MGLSSGYQVKGKICQIELYANPIKTGLMTIEG